MYVPYFIAYMAIGLGIALPVLWWALNNGQFRDQQRARFLPLEAEPAQAPARVPKLPKLEMVALFVLAAGGLAASAAVLVFAIINHQRV